jgi:hypothetical protein
VKELTLVAEALEASKSVLGFLDERQRGGWRYPDEVNSSIEIDVALQAGYRPSGLSRIGMRTQRGKSCSAKRQPQYWCRPGSSNETLVVSVSGLVHCSLTQCGCGVESGRYPVRLYRSIAAAVSTFVDANEAIVAARRKLARCTASWLAEAFGLAVLVGLKKLTHISASPPIAAP